MFLDAHVKDSLAVGISSIRSLDRLGRGEDIEGRKERRISNSVPEYLVHLTDFSPVLFSYWILNAS